jgi:hydroxyethylthiazole kinase-like uncharacterized protein yjeF
MIEAWPSESVRTAEQPLLAAGVPLMERASFALAVHVVGDLRARRRSVRGAAVALLVGAGNNGGDALYAGAYLARRGCAVSAVLVDERAHAGGLAALLSAGGRVVPLYEQAEPGRLHAVASEVARADVVLDGILGIGARGALRGLAAELVPAVLSLMAGTAAPWVVAVDVPSGIGVDDGAVAGPALPADRTVTFGAAKPGLLLPPAAHLAGQVTVVDIGIEPGGAPAVRRLTDTDVAEAWPVPGPQDHKYTRGVVGVVAGTSTYPGAAVLTSSAAVLAGAGMVRYGGPDAVGPQVLAARPEVVTAGGRVQAWALGSGVPAGPDVEEARSDDGQRERIRTSLAAASGRLGADAPQGTVPAVVDAGALDLVGDECPAWVVLTPHAGELATLLWGRGEQVDRAAVEAEPARWARRAHELTGATVLLKGAATVVVGPGGVLAQADAPSWLATAGSGDVLAGLLAAMLAARSEEVVAHPERAAEVAAAAALVHGRAGARANAGGPVAALDVATALPHVVAELVAPG